MNRAVQRRKPNAGCRLQITSSANTQSSDSSSEEDSAFSRSSSMMRLWISIIGRRRCITVMKQAIFHDAEEWKS
ncbi:hypothetical protein PGIGA_G00112650 [Pangasianodon gigas]|uniref:Uncharacterized protein n=1 Tax=Pangasianodon gigas TaxID=30993 RepID=A0ACC5WBD6_PANGG|nr:hypothetical protein [Pangasianodon gigas]